LLNPNKSKSPFISMSCNSPNAINRLCNCPFDMLISST